jgi:hypothetical protein
MQNLIEILSLFFINEICLYLQGDGDCLAHLPSLWAFLSNTLIISLRRLIALKYTYYVCSLMNSAVQNFGPLM